MILTAFEILLTLTVPALLLRARNAKFVSLLGTAGCAYLFGILYALAAGGLHALDVLPSRDTSAAEIICYLGVSIAIPLLLFSSNLHLVKKLSGKTLVCFLLLVLSVLLVTGGFYLAYLKKLPDGNVLGGMAAALYTGGTPNLNAVAYVFGLDSDTLLAANVSDIIFGGVFYAFLLFGAKPLLAKFLNGKKSAALIADGPLYDEKTDAGVSWKEKGVLRNLLLSLLGVVLSAGAGLLLWVCLGAKDGEMTNYLMPALMIGTTVFGILCSFSKKIREVRGNVLLGQYFVGVFSFSIASMLDPEALASVSGAVFLTFAVITAGTFFTHALLCKIFKINAGLMITTATAGIYGPAFVPSVTSAIGEKELLPTGLILGSLGYAVGTFLGILVAKALILL